VDPEQAVVQIDAAPGELRVELCTERLTGEESGEIQTEVNPWLARKGDTLRRLSIDASRVKHVTSTGLGALLVLRNRAQEYGAATVIRGAGEPLRAVIEKMKVGDLFVLES